TKALFGGTNPAACLYAKGEFIEKNPVTCQKLVNAFKKSLDFIAKSTPDEIAATVPEEYYLGDKAVYIKSLAAVRDAYSRTGVISDEGHASIMDMLVKLDKDMAGAKIPKSKTFDGAFIAKAG
ncbi:MAG: ABC transporter substrate-binding protein, partial [Proteobacteria bacterium]|nr:ABC transporter substrate-binding protein [Pseudomonadota bacterium]